jgi:hypothetical protein
MAICNLMTDVDDKYKLVQLNGIGSLIRLTNNDFDIASFEIVETHLCCFFCYFPCRHRSRFDIGEVYFSVMVESVLDLIGLHWTRIFGFSSFVTPESRFEQWGERILLAYLPVSSPFAI